MQLKDDKVISLESHIYFNSILLNSRDSWYFLISSEILKWLKEKSHFFLNLLSWGGILHMFFQLSVASLDSVGDVGITSVIVCVCVGGG